MAEKKYGFKNIDVRTISATTVPQVLKMIKNREYGLEKKSSFESRVTKLNVQKLILSDDEFEIDPDISYCKFLRAGNNGSLIGVWQKNMEPASPHSSMYHLKFEYEEQHDNSEKNTFCPIVADLSCSGPFFKRMNITDTCERTERDQSFLLYVGNTAISGGRIVLNITSPENSTISSLSEVIWRSPKCIWSCACSSLSGKYAAGAEKGFFIFDHTNILEIDNLNTNILAVEFDKSGNLLYCGRDKEEFLRYDLRQDICSNLGIQFSNSGLIGIKEIKLLSDDRTMIVCGTEGKLWRVDLRTNRTVFQYPGYINSCDRRPFSFNEGLNLLCATGDDNRSQIWSLQSGELLKLILPFDHGKTRSHLCLVEDQSRWFLASVRANILTPYLHDV